MIDSKFYKYYFNFEYNNVSGWFENNKQYLKKSEYLGDCIATNSKKEYMFIKLSF